MSKKHLVRILSLVLAVIMLITLVPADTLSFGAAGGVVSEAEETAPAEETLPVVETLPTEEFEAESTAADSEPFNVVRDGVLTADSDGAAGPVDPGVSAGAAAEISAPETQAPAEQASAAETASPETQVPAGEAPAAETPAAETQTPAETEEDHFNLYLDPEHHYLLRSVEVISDPDAEWTSEPWKNEVEDRYRDALEAIAETESSLLRISVKNTAGDAYVSQERTAFCLTYDAWQPLGVQGLNDLGAHLYLADAEGHLTEVVTHVRLTEEGQPALFFETDRLSDLLITVPAQETENTEEINNTNADETAAVTETVEAEEETTEEEAVAEYSDPDLIVVNPLVHPLEEEEASDNEPLLAADQLNARTRALLGLMPAAALGVGGPRLLAADPGVPTVGPVSGDGTTIEHITVKWLSHSTDSEEPAGTNRLELSTDSSDVAPAQFQINFALSGTEDHEPGTIEIVIPARLWHDRNGNWTGNLSLSLPHEPGKGADFAWRQVGDNIVITNMRRLSPATKVMIQGDYNSASAQNIVDIGVDPESPYAGMTNIGEFNAAITVTTANDQTISLQSNTIDATLDTDVEAASAVKSAQNNTTREYYVYHTAASARSAGIPEEFLSALGPDVDNYSFVRWYVSGSATGSQPFTMTIHETFDGNVVHYLDALNQESETVTVDGRILGVQGAMVQNSDGTYVKGNVVAPGDGQEVTAVLYHGYNTDIRSANVWTAYRQDSFPTTDGSNFRLSNQQTIEVTGWDNMRTTTKSASASVPFRLPITYTVVKHWDDNNNNAGRRPSSLYFNNAYNGLTLTGANAVSGDPSTWSSTYSDNGFDRTNNVSENYNSGLFQWHIVPGSERTGTDAGGDYFEYNVWRYVQTNRTYDPETHTWSFTNAYEEQPVKTYRVPFAVPYSDASSSKSANSHTNSNRMATTDRALNILRRGGETVVSYNVSGSAHVMPYTRGDGMDAGTIDSYGHREVTLRLEDNYADDNVNNLLRFDDRLTMQMGGDLEDDAEIAWVIMTAPTYSRYGQWGSGAPIGIPSGYNEYYGWSYSSVSVQNGPDEILMGLINGEWKEFAILHRANGSNTIETMNGASSSPSSLNNETGWQINLPNGVERVYTQLTIPAVDADHPERIDYARMNYRIGVRLFGSETVRQRLEAVFSETDYGMCTLDNFSRFRVFDDQGNAVYNRTSAARAYLHGRNYRVAVTQDKTFTATNDVDLRQLIIHTTVTMTQQSNVLEADEYWASRADGSIPSTTSGVWYDLLPLGVRPDLSTVQLTNGNDRIVDRYTIENYANSGRIMLVVRAELEPNVSYTRASDPNPYPNDITYPREGYKDVHTLTFDSTYSWDSARLYGIGRNVRNVAAFETDDTALGNIPGWSGEPDDPTANNNQRAMNAVGAAKDLMTGLDPNRPVEDKANAFVYSGAVLTTGVINFWARTELRKYVTREGLGVWTTGRADETQVTVHEGDYYTYMLFVNSAEGSTKNMIFLDTLESYIPTSDDGTDYGHGRWQGDFDSVDLSTLESLGIRPVVYYNTASNVNLEGLKNLSTGTDSGALIMPEADTVRNYLNDSANGWTTQMPADPSTVRAIAVDISQRQNGSDFELEEGAELYFTVRMRARTYETVGEDTDPYNADENLRQDEVNNDYAYNNVYLGCTQVDAIGQESHAVVNYNYTRVGILPLELEVTKVWNDANNNDGVRPNAITVYLLANGERIPDADDPTGYRSITLNEANNWRGVFQHLTQNDENGNHINYTFEEVSADSERSLEGYTQTVNRRDQHVTLTNRYTPETISFPFEKVWEGDDTEEARAYRPESITVRLYADGEFTGRTLVVRPDRAGNWAGTFTDLPRYTNPTGKSGDQQEIEYTIEEQEVYRYVDSYELDADTGVTTITNQYYPFGDLTVRKHVENATPVSADQAFTFTLYLQDQEGNDVTEQYAYSIYAPAAAGATEPTVISSGTIGNGDSFELHDGEYLTVKDIPSETAYRVVEEETPGFELTSSPGSAGSIRAGAERTAEFTNRYAAAGTQSVSIYKTLTGRTMTRYQFRFEMLDVTSLMRDVIDGSVAPSDVDLANAEALPGASADSNGIATFADLTYTEADHDQDFYYLLREENRGRPGYKYDPTVYIVKVHVTDNGDGTMTCTPTYYKADKNEPANQQAWTEIADPADHETGVVFRNEYHATGNITLRAWKQLDGGELSDYNQFAFALYRMDNDPNSRTYGQVLEMIGDPPAASDHETGTITFDTLRYTEADVGKTFFYIIEELPPNDPSYYPGVVFDENPLRGIEVSVEDNGNGTLNVSQKNVTIVMSTNESGRTIFTRGEDTEDLPVFVNHLDPGRLTITKRIDWDGHEAGSDPEFTFRLTLVDDGEHAIPQTLTVIRPGETAQVELGEDDGYMNGIYTFTLHGDETLTVLDLPAGMAYQVQEETPSGWTLTTENAAGTITPYVEGDANHGAVAATFTNKYEPGVATVNLVASKLMDGRPAPVVRDSHTGKTHGEFVFELYEYDSETGTYSDQPVGTAVNQAGGYISFNMRYELPDGAADGDYTYTYALREVQGLAAWIAEDGTIHYVDADSDRMRTVIFDESEYLINVTVTKTTVDGNITLTASVEYPNATEENPNGTPPQFRNATRPGSLQITKIGEGLTEALTDADGNVGPLFTFRVRFSNDAGMPLTPDDVRYYTESVQTSDTSYVAPETRPAVPAQPENAEPAANAPAASQAAPGLMMAAVGAAEASEPTPDRAVPEATETIAEEEQGNEAAQVMPPRRLLAAAAGAPVLRAAGDPATVTACGYLREGYNTSYSSSNRYAATGSVTVGATPAPVSWSHSVKWTLYSDGTLVIEPENGVSGQFWGSTDESRYTYNYNYDVWPWYSYRNDIRSIIVKDKVTVTRGIVAMLYRYTNLESADLSGLYSTNSTYCACNCFTSCSKLKFLDMRHFKITEDMGRRHSYIYLNDLNTCNNLQMVVYSSDYQVKSNVSSSLTGWRNLDTGATSNNLNNTKGDALAGTWVRGNYTANFTLAFDGNGEYGSMDPMTCSITAPVTLPGNEGFTSDMRFAGWAYRPDAPGPDFLAGQTVTHINGAMPNSTVTLYAIWAGADDFFIHYNENDGLCNISTQIAHGINDIVTLPTATHPHYAFLGWNTKQDGSGYWFANTFTGAYYEEQTGTVVKPGDTIELYAQYADPANFARVIVEHYYQIAGSDSFSATPYETDYLGTYRLGTSVQAPGPKAYAGFFPPESCTVVTSSGTVQHTTVTPTVSVVRGGVTIRYYYTRTQYTLAFEGNFGEAGGDGTMASMTMYGGVSTKLPVNRFTRSDGALFVGWNTEPDGSGTSYGDGQNVNSIAGNGETLTLYAQWFDLGSAAEAEPTNGEYIVQCRANERIIFPSLPAGTRYEITEVELPAGWTLSEITDGNKRDGDNAFGTDAVGTINSAERTLVSAKNTYQAVGYADIVAHKALPGETVNEGQFTFELIDDATGQVIQTAANSPMDTQETTSDDDGNPIQNVNMGTAPVLFDSIRYDHQGVYHYTIREVAGTDSTIRYDSHAEHVTVYVTDDGNGRLNAQVLYDESGANFVNRMSDGCLRVSKTLRNATEQAAQQSFSFTLYLNDSQGNVITESYPVTIYDSDGNVVPQDQPLTVANGGSVSIRGGQSFVVEGLPHKSTYVVVENPTDGYELVSSTGTRGEITAGSLSDAAEASFVNAYTVEGEAVAVIEAVKVFDHGTIGAEQFPFRLLDGQGEEIETVYADEDGHVEFSGLHFSLEDDGKRFTYYIEEVVPEEADRDPHIVYDEHQERVSVIVTDNGDGTMTAEVEYSGTTPEEQAQPCVFTNEYHPEPTDITIPVVKKVTGNPPSNETFTFRLEPVTEGAPMPANDTVTINGAGRASFSPITFLYGGVYEYRLTEAGGNAAGYTYDTAPRTITVTVTDTNGVLSAAWKSDDQTVSAVEFTNTYTPPEEPTEPETPPTEPETPPTEPETPPVTPPTPDTPPTPAAPPAPQRTTVITDDRVPLAIPGGPKQRPFRTDKRLETIEDGEVPLALPETGDVSGLWMWLSVFGGSGAAMLGAAVKRKKKKEK